MNSSKNSDISILYITGISDDREIIDTLENEFGQVVTTDNSFEAIKTFKHLLPQLVIIHIDNPNIASKEILSRAKSLREDTHIIVISSFDDKTHLLDALDIGVDSYLLDPVDIKKLKSAVKKSVHFIAQEKKILTANNHLKQYQKIIDKTAIYSKTDTKGIITYANEEFEAISGYSKEELIGKPHNIVRHPDTPKDTFKDMWGTILQGQVWKGIVRNRKKNGGAYTVESTVIPITNIKNEIVEFVAIRHDISDLFSKNVDLENLARRKSEELIDALYKDDNTSLLNSLALQRDIKEYQNGTLFLLDINNFNIYNKLHGFSFGDKLLKYVANDLKSVVYNGESIYKLGADRYAILSHKYEELYIDDLVNQLFAFFDTNEIEVDTIENLITFSVGVAKVESGLDTIVNAEFALDLSKKHGKRFKLVYEKETEKIQEERDNILWLKKSRDYIIKDMITPYFQPIVDVRDETIFKYEALARVIDEDGFVITPDKFLGSASRLGLLSSITKSMINKTFKKFSGTDIQFSINITERDILDGYLMDFIKTKSKKFNINPNNVTFEILENLTLSKEGDFISKTISLVKDYGCKIAIDDFGSENSNFSRILSLRSDYIKIDGAFVVNCDQDLEKQKIISAIVQLAKRLQIKTIAEYVSTKEIFEVIKEIGVDYAQGFYFGKPESLTN